LEVLKLLKKALRPFSDTGLSCQAYKSSFYLDTMKNIFKNVFSKQIIKFFTLNYDFKEPKGEREF